MSGQAWLLLGTLATAACTLLAAHLKLRQDGRQTRTTDAQQIIDQLQEMASAAEGKHQRELSEVRGEVAELRGRVIRMENRELAFFDYIQALRWHIDQRMEPPPPPWPAALMRPTNPPPN